MGSGDGLPSLNLEPEYRTNENDPVDGFYRPCLASSIEYKRAVGYFRSSIFLIIGDATLDFARRGGRLRLICSPSISEEDIQSIGEGYGSRSKYLDQALSMEIDRLLVEPSTSYRTRVLATLIAVGAMEVRIAFRPGASGIYHEKIGIFRDSSGQRVSFLGSANETWNAWHRLGNHEAIEVFREWEGSEGARVSRHDQYFESLWSGQVRGVEVVPFPEASRTRLLDASLGAIDDVDPERMIYSQSKRTPLPHQTSALDAWRLAGFKGVFEHATGSGKTFTALLAIRDHISKGLPAIVLVPSQLLLEQWASEIQDEIPDAVLLICGAGNDTWRKNNRLSALTDSNPGLGPRIVLSTMATAASEIFLAQVQFGDHLLIVADEVHQAGSPHNSKVFRIESGKRLGLSATPSRYGDLEGTAKIFEYFGNIIPPSVSLRDAVKAGRLVPYEYHPHPVHLNAEESLLWSKLTLQIRREFGKGMADANGSRTISERARLLLIRRSRIAKRAAAKIGLAVGVLRANFEDGQRWLVYCEDSEQLNEVKRALRDCGFNPIEYHTGMPGGREETLAWFMRFGGVLVSIRCLDEGVDIPSVSHALVLASSQNPRQFIQRRGRVLRKAPDKYLAVIHDAIVVPIDSEDEPDQMALLKSEFARALEFAGSASNATAGADLRSMAIALGIDPDSLLEIGIEEEID